LSYDLVVLAAGLGSRYGGAKQLEALGPGGETLMDYAIYDAVRAGVERVVFVARREHRDAFQELFSRRYGSRLEVVLAFQEIDDLPRGFAAPPGRAKPWGTAHAVWAARHAVRRPFATINADDFYGREGFARLGEFFARTSAGPADAYALVTYELGRTLSEHGAVSRGVCVVDAERRLVRIEEVTGIRADDRRFRGDEPVSMNLWGLRPSIFDQIEVAFERFLRRPEVAGTGELYLPSVIAELIESGGATVEALPVASAWIGLTHREDRLRAEKALAELGPDYPSPLWG
jgi:dTDP-glucose pyrophosphorylase